MIQATSPIIDIMFKSVCSKLIHVHLSPLSEPHLGCASQKEIDPNRVILLSTCAVHYNLDFGHMVWFLRREYTTKHRDIGKLVHNMYPFISKADMKQMVRVLTTGCPHDLDFKMPHKEKLKMIK